MGHWSLFFSWGKEINPHENTGLGPTQINSGAPLKKALKINGRELTNSTL
jgi:hypothetical protein